MAADNLKKLFLVSCLIGSVLWCRYSYGEFTWEIRGELPELPEGLEAGDIELTVDRAISEINIPGFTRTDSYEGRITFRKNKAIEKICTLDKKSAGELAEAFLDRYFPSLAGRYQLLRCAAMMVSRYVEGKQGSQPQVEGYMLRYAGVHRSIPILNDRIGVTIKGDEVVAATILVHSVKEVGKPRRLLSAEECLAKASDELKQRFDACTVRDVVFGYHGGFRQHWEDEREEWSKPFKAVPAYEFIIRPRQGGVLGGFVLDARTAELIYPKRAEGKTEVAIPGPELKFSKSGSWKLFLIGPRDIKIKKAVLELENKPVRHSWVTYSVKEIFVDTGQWRFANYNTLFRNWLVLDSNKDRKSIARGTLNIEASDEYEVEVLVFQGPANDRVCAVQISINGRSQVLGTKGPGTARVWEKWGMINLNRGEHEIVLGLVPDSRRGEIGGVRLRKTSGMSISSVKGLKITFGRQDNPDYYNASPPVGRFETKDCSAGLKSALRDRLSRDINDRNICTISISSASAGILCVDSLKVSFVTGNQELAEQKAHQFILIYPDGNSSRAFSLGELKIFASYVQRVMDSAKGRRRNPCELINLCGLVKKLTMKCEGEAAKQIRAEFEIKYIELAREEADRLIYLWRAHNNDWPKPASFPNEWAKALVVYRAGLDESRLTDGGGYLDPWGNPYVLEYFPKEKRLRIHSWGPDVKDDEGSGDDIEAEGELEWFS